MASCPCPTTRPCYNFGLWDFVYAVFSSVRHFVVRIRVHIDLIGLSRWLVNNGREDEALQVLSRARGLPPSSELVQIEFL